MSLILIIFKQKKKEFPQEIFDNIFQNIEFHIRELGYGDVAVNKKMKILTRIFFDILLKIKNKKVEEFSTDKDILTTYFEPEVKNKLHLIEDLAIYFNNFYNFCFELDNNNMLKGRINFKP